jgi:hypothetical protein
MRAEVSKHVIVSDISAKRTNVLDSGVTSLASAERRCEDRGPGGRVCSR